jgi:hypothetical protein
MSKCEPTRILVGASRSPTSENRNSISNARPRDVTFTRQEEKSLCSFWIAIFAWKAEIDMPPGIARIVWMRKTDREGAKTFTRTPTPLADDLIERSVESGRIDCFPEWFLSIRGQYYEAAADSAKS